VSEALLQARGISKRFGPRLALAPLDLELRGGDRLAVLGPNGAGKSTLLRLLSGLARPTAGEIELLGVPRGQSRRRLRSLVGYLGHASLLYPALSAEENLELAGRLYGLTDPKARSRELLDELDLRRFAEQRVESLSRGVGQRVAVARALVHRPRLLLLDEPFSGLDPDAAPRLERLLSRILEDSERAMLLVTHDLAGAGRRADRALVLRGGRHQLIEPANGGWEDAYARCQEALESSRSR